MRRKILPLVLGGALSIAAIGPVAANGHQTVNQDAVQRALVGIIVQAAVRDVTVVELNNSLNNLLQNADINVEIIEDVEVTVENVLNNLNVNVSDIEITVSDIAIVVNILGAGGVLLDTVTIPLG